VRKLITLAAMIILVVVSARILPDIGRWLQDIESSGGPVRPPPPIPPAPPPIPPARLRIVQVALRPSSPQPGGGYRYYDVAATIVNDGPGQAANFSTSCAYQCPFSATMYSGGIDLVSGGFLAGRSVRTYPTSFVYQCGIPIPLTLGLVCTIQSASGQQTFYFNPPFPH
jgi:hypothetical protein